MPESVSRTLEKCLRAMEEGEGSGAKCLDRYPAHEAELEALLETAALLRAAPEVLPHPAFRQAARCRLLNRLAVRSPVRFWHRLAARWQLGPGTLFAKRLAVVLMLAVVLTGVLLGGGRAVSASGGALPGDALYPVKVAVEDVRLVLAGDESTFRLYLEFANTRVDEMERLSAEDRFEDVPVAASRFGRQVQGAAGLVTEVDTLDAERSKALAEELDASLAAHRASLHRLLETVPVSVRPAVERALEDADDEPEEKREGPAIDGSERQGDQEGDPNSFDGDEGTIEDDSSDDRGDEPGSDDSGDGSVYKGDTDDKPGGSLDDALGSEEDMDDGAVDSGGIESEDESSDASGSRLDADEHLEAFDAGPPERDDATEEASLGGGTSDDRDESSPDRSQVDVDQEGEGHSGSSQDSGDNSNDDSRSISDDRSGNRPDDEHHSPDPDSSDSSPGGSDDDDRGDSESGVSSSSDGSERSDHGSPGGSEHHSEDREERD